MGMVPPLLGRVHGVLRTNFYRKERRETHRNFLQKVTKVTKKIWDDVEVVPTR
jgi:hypothetical protein